LALVVLRSGRLVLEIAPTIGGSVTRLDRIDRDGPHPILRPSDEAALTREGASQAAMHPLVPFANRVPGNLIDLVDPPLSLQPNVTGESAALHGIGWQRPWRVLEARQDFCTLELSVPQQDWTFGFRATQAFTLEDDRLRAEIALENTSDRAIPAGFGFHPYFVRRPGMTLQFRADHFWLEGPGHLPTEAIALPPELDFVTPMPLPYAWRNNCYSGWDGRATLCDPHGPTLHMTASTELPELMLYTPPGAQYFCLEPQSHTPGAATKARAGRPATPLRVLAPSQRMAATLLMELG
jgi:aldose 1-epimerase